MKTLYLSIIGIFILLVPIVYQVPVYAPTAVPNNSTGSYDECQKKIGDDMQMVVNSINKTKAILLATRSNDFQSKVSGYKYVFSDIFTNMTENQKTCDDVKLISIVTEFSILDNSSKFVKFVEVGEDPSLTQVTLVEDVFVQKCDNNCPPPGPPATDTIQDQQPLTPLRQIASGVAPKDVMCKSGFALVLKAEDQSPACVKPQTAKKLVERGWGTFPDSTKQAIPILSHSINITNTGLIANYNITRGTVSTIIQARPDLYDIELKPITNGSLSITLPEYLIKGKIYVMGNHDKLLNYGEVFDYNHEKRTITIYFNQDDKFIQLTSESEWRALTNPLPCKGGCGFP